MLSHHSTYEIMTPESVGVSKSSLVLGKHSGRHALKDRLRGLGYQFVDDIAKLNEQGKKIQADIAHKMVNVFKEDDLDRLFKKFKRLADMKKDIFDEDLVALITDDINHGRQKYELKALTVKSGTDVKPQAEVVITIDGKEAGSSSAESDGPVDAALKAIASIVGTDSEMLAYEVKAITGGTDAQGEVSVKLRDAGKTATGHGADTDIIVASAKAYINALNKLYYLRNREKTVENMCE